MKNIFIKFFISIIITTSFIYTAYAQEDRKAASSLTYDRIFSNYNYNKFSLNLEFFISKNISLNYNFAFDHTNDVFNYHIPAGIMTGLNFLKEGLNDNVDEDSREFYYTIAAISLFIPEGISFYIPMSDRAEIITTLNLLAYDSRNENTITGSIILHLRQKLTDKFFISPHIGIPNIFGDSRGLLFGIGIGFQN